MEFSQHIYGIHEFDAEWGNWLVNSGRTGWSLELTELSNNYSGSNFNFLNVTPIVRLNWGYGSTGTIPRPDKYDEFARRSAEFVKNSQGVKRVHIGNELSLQWEWPDGVMPSVDEYVQCYLKCYYAIKSVRPDVMITFAPPGPWNPTWGGDWIDIIKILCDKIGHDKIDFFAFHAYTKGYDLDNFTKLQPMNPPYQHRNFSFAVLWEQMNAIPKDMRHLEVHITEANGDDSWNHNNGNWIKEFYNQINNWNQNPSNQKILSGILFRWNKHDTKWDMSNHEPSKQDFRQALQKGYKHGYNASRPNISIQPKLSPDAPQIAPRKPCVTAEAGLNLREAPVIDNNVIEVIPYQRTIEIINDMGDWLNVRYGSNVGWVNSKFVQK